MYTASSKCDAYFTHLTDDEMVGYCFCGIANGLEDTLD
jgi:hypothetical protein